MTAVEAEVVAPLRICRNCRHAMLATGSEWRFAECALTEHIDLVTGNVEHTYCGAERLRDHDNGCGIAGKNFEPRT